MTRPALDVLRSMADGTEFAYDFGYGYLGNCQVKKAKTVLMELLHAMAIRRVAVPMGGVERYVISETGREILARLSEVGEG